MVGMTHEGTIGAFLSYRRLRADVGAAVIEHWIDNRYGIDFIATLAATCQGSTVP
jgi:hypothetical protein